MKRKKSKPRQQPRPDLRQRKGEKLLTQLSELKTLFAELDPQPAAGEDIFSFGRRSA